MQQLQRVSNSERLLTPSCSYCPSYEKQGPCLCQNKLDFTLIPSPPPPAPWEAAAEAVLHQPPSIARVPRGPQSGVLSKPRELSIVREQHWLAALSLSQLDVTNSLPMTSPARYSVPASSEQAEDRAGGDCFGQKDFSAKAGNIFPSSLCRRANQPPSCPPPCWDAGQSP